MSVLENVASHVHTGECEVTTCLYRRMWGHNMSVLERVCLHCQGIWHILDSVQKNFIIPSALCALVLFHSCSAH